MTLRFSAVFYKLSSHLADGPMWDCGFVNTRERSQDGSEINEISQIISTADEGFNT